MSFPIDYRFYGKTKAVKYRLVGNAVPPKMAYAFASAILEDINVSLPKSYKPILFCNKVDFYNLNFQIFTPHEEKPKRTTARFKYHIPYLKSAAYRVELTNYHSDFRAKNYRWDVEIHRSQGKSAKIYTPEIAGLEFNPDQLRDAKRFIEEIVQNLPSFNEFQEIYCMTTATRNDQMGPYQLLKQVREFIDKTKDICNSQEYVNVEEEPYRFPGEIAVGYFILSSAINHMRMVSNG
jgi:DNA (cytosine-5)-methyltransferase 1